jgi:CheY-like chemotaxis protein
MGMLKVLIIDDDPRVARSMSRMIREHEVAIETDAVVAVARLQDGELFDVIVCDRTMPTFDGLEVLRVARACDEPPIFILMSGAETSADTGADGYLIKPFRTSELRDLIAKLVDDRSHAPVGPVVPLRLLA